MLETRPGKVIDGKLYRMEVDDTITLSLRGRSLPRQMQGYLKQALLDASKVYKVDISQLEWAFCVDRKTGKPCFKVRKKPLKVMVKV